MVVLCCCWGNRKEGKLGLIHSLEREDVKKQCGWEKILLQFQLNFCNFFLSL